MKNIVLIACLLASVSVVAEEVSQADAEQLKQIFATVPMNTYRFVGKQIVCKSEDATDRHACDRMGIFKLGEKLEVSEQPWKEMPLANGEMAAVFPIVSDEINQAYWVIGHKDNHVTSIQLSGNFSQDGLSFATIKLLDTKAKVEQILGTDYLTTEVNEIAGTLWDYAPFPLTIEFKGDAVYSIRISLN